MESQIVGKVRINGSIEYECFYIDTKMNATNFTVVVKSESFDKIKEDFTGIKTLEILDFSNAVTRTTNKYTDISSIETRFGVYFNAYGSYVDAYRIVLKSADLEALVKKLDEKVFPVVDYESMPLNEFKDIYINKSKASLSEYLKENPITSTAHGGKQGVYSVTKEKQDLMASKYLAYKLEKETNPEAELTWNETGKPCESWTEEEFIQLIIEIKKHVEPFVVYQQEIEAQIRNAKDKEEIVALTVDYASVE